ncbi:hypothetical protein QR680_011125 [Steinernema hermaphroditum]|uniref:7TM GPCR serpentine receptor class x (Srx) domain-containing protein n=1 Tax=Steinernema hermaphroditum TaxID=289476 RepID=A0AA39IR92_9BILA|nr:hypothetical protein QR680_011125 [Steinernema hermaphroditum]
MGDRQPTNIPPALAIFAYQFSVTFGYVQCVMNLVIATNRFIAVCYPLRYKSIFNKTVCVSVALNVAMQGVLCISLYFSECLCLWDPFSTFFF